MKTITVSQFALGIALGVLIACSPTKFSNPSQLSGVCNASTNCVQGNGYEDYTNVPFKVGAGKVDILFIDDNSASMSKAHVAMASKFSGFIQNLDTKQIDYRIAITTTDVASVGQKRLVAIGGANPSFLTKNDPNRINLFNNSIRRNETIQCEDHITAYFNTFNVNFQSAAGYQTGYIQKCPSSDTRGLYTGNMVVSDNADSFMRTDANLNIILISNDDVRQGRYLTDSNYALDVKDTAEGFKAMMQSKYPIKYWDFNSIVVGDSTCKANQTLRNASNIEVTNQMGPAIAGGIGTEYIKLSSSAAVDIDNDTRSRGLTLDICQANYSGNFALMAVQISQAARMKVLNCTPTAAPVVSPANIPYTWNGNKLVFNAGSEGIPVTISYRCYTGAL
ncbi:MAG: hypothetical protein H7328_05065 [Bdellovibrio sp.]|nr:hypothetical protein [Bdellovibrio sp.]